MSGKQRILTIDHQWPYGPLNGIIVQLNTTIFKEERQPVPMLYHIGQRLADGRFIGSSVHFLPEPLGHILQKGGRLFLPDCPSGRRGCPPDTLFNLIELPNAPDRLVRHRGQVGFLSDFR